MAVGGLDVVAAGEHPEEAGRVLHRGGGAVERAVVREDLGADREDLPLAGRCDLTDHHVVAGEAGAHQVLAAVLHPLDRLARDEGRDDRADVPGIDGHLVAEPAADVRGDHPDLVFGQTRDEGVEGAVGVRRLARRPQRELAGDPVVVGHGTAGFHRRRVHPGIDHLLPGDHVGLRERGFGGGGVPGLPVEAVVVGLALEVGADHRGLGCEGATDVDDRIEDVVLDVDEFEGVAGGVPVLGDDEGDLLALEADLVGGEDGLDVVGQGRHPGQALVREVGAGDDGPHLRVGLRGAGVDAEDLRVRDRGAQDRQVQHAG